MKKYRFFTFKLRKKRNQNYYSMDMNAAEVARYRVLDRAAAGL